MKTKDQKREDALRRRLHEVKTLRDPRYADHTHLSPETIAGKIAKKKHDIEILRKKLGIVEASQIGVDGGISS